MMKLWGEQSQACKAITQMQQWEWSKYNMQANTVAVMTSGTPNLPGVVTIMTEADKTALIEKQLAEDKARRENALAKFDSTVQFRLEGQVIGQATSRKTSKAGAVTVGIKTKKDLAVVSGLKGNELDAFMRIRRDEMKGKQSELAARISGDNNWTGHAVKMSAKGDKITLEYVKAAPVTVALAAEPTDEQIAGLLGISVEDVAAYKADKAKADAAKESAAKS